MTREAIRARIEEIGIIPAIRVSSANDALFAIETLADSGIPVAEVTMTIPGAIGLIESVARKDPGLIIGAGTVVNLETARRCLDAGARFLTSPGLDSEIVEFAVKHDAMVFPGALTPSEIMAAWKAGSDFVKVYPCALLGGPSYIRTLKPPFPEIRMIASGGVNQQNAAEFIQAGAAALGIGRDLVNGEAVRRRERDWIHELSLRFLQIVREARGSLAG